MTIDEIIQQRRLLSKQLGEITQALRKNDAAYKALQDQCPHTETKRRYASCAGHVSILVECVWCGKHLRALSFDPDEKFPMEAEPLSDEKPKEDD